MSATFRTWLAEELARRGWSHNELGRRADISQTAVSNVISGNRNPGCDFCIRIANALGEAPEKVLRLAGILPTSLAPDDPVLAELRDLVESLPPERREETVRYLRFLLGQGRG